VEALERAGVRLAAGPRQRHQIVLVGVVLLLTALAGCGGDDGDGDGDKTEKKAEPVAGSFVGEVRGTDAFVGVVAAPPAKGQDEREVTAFVCDARRLCAWFSGSATGNGFTATSGDAEAKGRLSSKVATGSVELPGGETVRYKVGAAAATAGLYDLTVSAAGKLRGASAAGVALKGESTLPPPGSGNLKLADGTRLKFEVTRNSAEDATQLRPGQVRLIVLPDGQLRGVGKSRRGGSDFFIRSA
jgi:hypothetical protein